MTQTIARIRRGKNNFEILVDLEEALKVKKGGSDISSAVLTDSVFYNLKSGEHAAKDILEIEFKTGDFYVICEKIIRSGEVVLPTDYIHEKTEERYKQVIDFLVKNAVSPEGRPYTSDRFMTALKEAKIVVKNKPIESQIAEIVGHLQKILPLKLETKRIRLTIAAQHTGKAYGLVNDYKEEEEWLSNGDLVITIKIASGMLMDFYERLNKISHGSTLAEELK